MVSTEVAAWSRAEVTACTKARRPDRARGCKECVLLEHRAGGREQDPRWRGTRP